MCSFKTGKIMPFHGTGKPFTQRGADYIDKLTGNKVIGGQFIAGVKDAILTNPEFN